MTLRYDGLLYRALNPIYAADPLSGRGAALFGGRFNPKGVEALYTSTTPETAIRESNQVGTLQPTTLVAYRADLTPIFDATDATALAGHGMTADALADPGWRVGPQPAPTQVLAQGLHKAGFAGMIVRSFAKGAPTQARNLVLWTWGPNRPRLLQVIDDEDRLGLQSDA